MMGGSSWLRVGAISGFLAVSFGAFAAHGLKEHLESQERSGTPTGGLMIARRLEVFETGSRYQMYHALALLAVGLLAARGPAAGALNAAGWAFLLGTLLFSGSLYALGLTGHRWLGAITPLGGVAFLLGWAALVLGARPGGGPSAGP